MSLFNSCFHTDVDLLGETSSTSFVSSPHSTSFNAQVWSNFCFPFQSSWSLKASQFIVIHFLLILITWWRDVQYDSTPAIQTPCVTMWIQYIHSITGWCVNMFHFLCILIPTAMPVLFVADRVFLRIHLDANNDHLIFIGSIIDMSGGGSEHRRRRTRTTRFIAVAFEFNK